MYAIVEIAGQQFKVVQDQKLFVHRLAEKEGAKFLLKKSICWTTVKKYLLAPRLSLELR